MKTRIQLILVALFLALASSSFATLLSVGLTFPKISYVSQGAFALNYTASSQQLTISASPTTVLFANAQPPRVISGAKSLQINVVVDNTGALVGGVSGDDFSLSGTVTQGTNTYSGVLLTGEVTGFGFLEAGSSDLYDFRFTPTGGALAGLFCGDISVQVVSEVSTFNNDFTTNFNGRAKGTVGSEDITPPTVTCPGDITAECQAFTNGLAGAYVSYPMPVVTDNCDANPTLVCTPPSGSFFPLPLDVAATNYTVTCIATDAAGNTNMCSFIITIQDTMPPEFADTNNPVVTCHLDGNLNNPLTLTNDPGMCYATFRFPKPYATDNCCPLIVPATVSAFDENGASIIITDLGNGYMEGQFPVNLTGVNTIIATASDGRGNSAKHECALVVVDKEPPTLLCADQTVTFKPILTNALSCITADFDSTCIAASNYLWFSSVIKNPACQNNSGSFTVHVFDQTIQLAVDNTNITLNVPDAYITFSNGVAVSSTLFTNGQWLTCLKPGLTGNTFISGLAWQLPFNLNNSSGSSWGRDRDDRDEDGRNRNDGRQCRRHVNSATWCARFAVDKPGVVLQWQWGAVVHTTMSTNYNALCVKPVDDDRSSSCKNSDPAGSCEKYKSYLACGGRGKGWFSNGRDRQPDCTGILSDSKRCNLGKGSICFGAVDFAPPLAVDQCGKSVAVVCTPPPGTVLGPGVHVVNCVATDASGNTNECSFNLNVLSPLQVVFDSPDNDNLDDNFSEPDDGFTDMNCPDDSSTQQIVTQFRPGDKICHSVRLVDCNGNDVTASMCSFVTVHIDVTERKGTYGDSVLINDVPQNYVCVGSPGGIMVPSCGRFQYNLSTSGYEAGTASSDKFFRSCVWVDYNSSPGVPVGLEDVILESK